MMDSATVSAIASLGQRQDEARLTNEVKLGEGSYTYVTNTNEYGRQLGELLTPPEPDPLLVSTLTGFRDALEAAQFPPGDFLIHVEGYLSVALKTKGTNMWGQRLTHVAAKHIPTNIFRFDDYYNDPQKFIIALQTDFLQTEELLYLIKIASSLKSGHTVQTKDDGFSQTITVKTGEVSTAEVNVRPRIKLVPLRSFSEAAPVESEFLIRFSQTPQQTPSIALFDVSGKKWQGELMLSIKNWLMANISPPLPIIA